MCSTQFSIEATGLSKTFSGQVVLRNIDLTVGAGEAIAILGANGTGKTTLLRCLAGALRPDGGLVRWHGRPARKDWRDRRLIGMLTHASQLYAHLTLQQNLVFAARMHGVPRPAPCANEWLERVGLRRYAHWLPTRISQGMRRRASVARALLHEPLIILLDEPFASLDTDGRAWLTGVLAGLQELGRSICFSTHDHAAAKRCADRYVCMRAGRLHKMAIGAGDPDARSARVAGAVLG